MNKILFSIVLVVVSNVASAATIYLDETNYLAALTAMGASVISEGFEDDVVWVDSRSSISSPGSTPQVNSQGILWRSNFATNNIATSDVGLAGSFGLYSDPHGDPDVELSDMVCDVADPIPEQCFLHDGFVGDSAGTLYGVGGWINGTSGADVTLLLDGVQVDFGTNGIINSWTFLGVIDTTGFNTFEFREINGKGTQALTIRADDVTLGVSAVPVPAAAWLFGSGLIGLTGIARRKKAA